MTQIASKPVSPPRDSVLPGGTAHLWQLDVLRAAAIIMVFCYHLQGTSYDSFGNFELYGTHPGTFFSAHWSHPSPAVHDPTLWLFYPYSLGQVGVVLFFVLSGFCIHHSTLQARRKAMAQSLAPPRFNYGSFMLRRAWRILPAYLVALVIFFVWQKGVAYRAGGAPFSGLGDFLWHALMLHNLRQSSFYSINASFWSLGVEWQFYLIYPLFLLLNRLGVVTAVAITGLLSIACQVIFAWKHLDVGPSRDVWNNFPLTTWFNWCIGALVAEYWNRGGTFFKMPRGVFVGLWLLMFMFAGFDQSNDWVAGIVGMAWPVLFAITLERYIHLKRPSTRFERLITPIGLCSYSLYLLHQPLLSPLLHAAHRWLHLPAIHWLDETMTAVLILAVLTGLAWVSFHFIETPGVKIGHRFSRIVKAGLTGKNSTLLAMESGTH
jgi:peptidoglycan/LPS O-acetylase OafA/YrhL